MLIPLKYRTINRIYIFNILLDSQYKPTSYYGLGYEARLDDIWIFDVENHIFIKSKIKCPQKGKFRAIATNNYYYSSLLTFGYINNLKNIPFIPKDIINLINSMYINQTIHIMQPYTTKEQENHWKIDGNELFDIK